MKSLFSKLKSGFSKIIPTKRRLIQLYAALLFNANLKGFKTGVIYKGPIKNICSPGLNCYSCPAASASCPLGALQNSLASSGARYPYYVFGILILYGMLFGRWICGFLCPFGLIQELLHKIKTPKLRKGKVTKALSALKYIILVVFVFIFPLLYAVKDIPLPAFCKYICPAGTLEGAVGLLSNKVNESSLRMLGPLFTWKFVLLVSFIVGCVFVFRLFCRFICPLGALYGLFNKISLVGVKVDKPSCTECGICISSCEMDISSVGDNECIFCGECIKLCPTGAISWRGIQGKITLDPQNTGTAGEGSYKSPDCDEKDNSSPHKNKGGRIGLIRFATLTLMAISLITALVYYNFYDGRKKEQPTGTAVCSVVTTLADTVVTTTDDLPDLTNDNHGTSTPTTSESPKVTDPILPPEGATPGKLCYGYDIPLFGDEKGSFNPSRTRGKITVINFWGIYCTACLAELPHFNELALKYGDKLYTVAIHYDYSGDKAEGYVNEHYSDYVIDFGIDDNDAYYNMLGGNGLWPMTLILDENGVIIEHIIGSVTFEELDKIVSTIINN